MNNSVSNFYRHVKICFDTFITTIVPSLQRDTTLSVSKHPHTSVIPYAISYLSPKLQDCINNHSYWLKQYNCFILQQQVHVNIYSSSQNCIQDNNILFVILFAIYYCSRTKNNMKPFEINIDIVLSKYKKMLRKDELIDEFHVNSGVTSYHTHSKVVNILIFRKEEVAKVLIHEIIHAMRLDDGHTQLVSNSVSSYFGSKNHLNINESFTETYACILNCALSSLIQNGGVRHFKQLLQNERDFSKTQSYKVLTKIGFSFGDNGDIRAPIDYKESTNIISYYVLKHVNFMKISCFLLFLEKCNFSLTNINEYINYLQERLSEYKWLPNKTITNTKNTSTLRMSSIELLDILGGNKKAYKTFYQ